MAEYKLQVSTGYLPSAGTWDHVYVTLIGSDGESEKTELDNWGIDFYPGKTGTYTVTTSSSLGKLLLVKVEKDPFLNFEEEEWYCSTIEVARQISSHVTDGFPGKKYVAEHWKEDDFYGYQFLNGVNPTLIKRCSELPRNFPVTVEMVKPFLAEGSSLMREIVRGCVGLMGPNGMFENSSAGLEGTIEIMRRSLREMTYSSVCLPENIAARGLESIPNYYYRDDGLKLWSIINNFVRAAVEYLYPLDADVYKDRELQEWIGEIFTYGLLSNKASGFPSSFHSIEELIKFITMVIFTVSVQHAAVNSGQFDYYFWTPNGPLVMHKPPPTTKGQSSMETIMETLPNVGETVATSVLLHQLSGKYSGVVPLGQYPEKRFDEPELTQIILEFQAEMSKLGEEIEKRNSQLELRYDYLLPSRIESSVSI